LKLLAIHDGTTFTVEVGREGAGYIVSIDERVLHADVVSAGSAFQSLRFSDGRQYLVAHHHESDTHEVSFGDVTIRIDLVDPLTQRRKKSEDDSLISPTLRAPMPGRVVRIFVSPGDSVEKGSPLLILEAMKMENEFVSPRAGVVRTVSVETGQTVESGVDLIEIE